MFKIYFGITILFISLLACEKEIENGEIPEYPEQPITQVKAPGSLIFKSLELYNKNDPTVLKQVQNLMADAVKILSKEAQSVMEKTFMPPSGDKHDYYSMGPYWWPNPNTADGLPYIRKDGQVNPESRDGTFDYVRFQETCTDIYTLAMAYWFSKDEQYRTKALEFVNVWFVDEDTRMNPNLNYGQAIPGVSEGRAAGVIETTNLFEVIDAFYLLDFYLPVPETIRGNLTEWFSEYHNWLFTHEIGIKEGQSTNNHGTWYGAQVSAFGLFAGMDDEVKDYIERKAMQRLGTHVMSDGTQPEELRRTKTLNYSLMNLRGHLMVANMAASLDMDMFNFQDNPLKLGMEYILNNLPPRGEWPHEQITSISSTHYNDLAQMITNYNHNPLSKEKISGADKLAVDLTDWQWLTFGGKP